MRIWFMSPGTIVAGSNIDIPADAPKIDEVVSARVIRIDSWLGDHAAHGHTIPADTSGTTEVAEILAGILGVGAGGAVQDAAAMSHAGSDPKLAATPTKVDEDTITLDIDIDVPDIVELVYVPVGGRVKP